MKYEIEMGKGVTGNSADSDKNTVAPGLAMFLIHY